MSDRRPWDEPVEEPAVRTITLESIQLECATLLARKGWQGTAESLRLDMWEDVRNFALGVRLEAHVLGMAGERRRVNWPATWRDHRRKAFLDWLASKGYVIQGVPDFDQEPATGWRRSFWRWVYAQVHRRLRPVKYATKEVQTYLSVCPHISAGPRHDSRLCIAYMHRMQLRGEDRGLVDVDGVLARYSRADYHASRAHAVLTAALEPVPAQQPFPYDMHRRAQNLEGAVRYALQLLEHAMEEGNNGR